MLVADSAEYGYGLAENTAPLIAGMAAQYSHVLAPATTFGKISACRLRYADRGFCKLNMRKPVNESGVSPYRTIPLQLR